MTNRRRAAVAMAGIVATSVLRRDTIRRLVDTVPRDRRLVEAKLTGGFRWAPLWRDEIRSRLE